MNCSTFGGSEIAPKACDGSLSSLRLDRPRHHATLAERIDYLEKASFDPFRPLSAEFCEADRSDGGHFRMGQMLFFPK